MKKVCWPLIFTFSPLLLLAQYEQILRNPDVIWAAELDVLYNLQLPESPDSALRNDILYWKNFDPKNQTPHSGGELLIENLLEAARTGAWPAWQFTDTMRQLSKTEVEQRVGWGNDTVVVFDVETGLDVVKVVYNDIDIANFVGIRAKQLLYFDEKKGDFMLYTSAIGPVRTEYTSVLNAQTGRWEYVYLYDYVPFWLKLPDASRKTLREKQQVNDPDITWAAQLKTIGNSPQLDKQRPFKDIRPPVMQVLLDRFSHDRRYQVRDPLNQPIPFESRNGMITSIDSVVTFDAETYEEKVMVEKNVITAESIYRLRLVENWFWDDRKKRLKVQLVRYAPLLEVRDDMDNYRFDRPLFYRH